MNSNYFVLIAKCCFLVILKYNNSNLNKTQYGAACDVIYLTIVAMETN